MSRIRLIVKGPHLKDLGRKRKMIYKAGPHTVELILDQHLMLFVQQITEEDLAADLFTKVKPGMEN